VRDDLRCIFRVCVSVKHLECVHAFVSVRRVSRVCKIIYSVCEYIASV